MTCYRVDQVKDFISILLSGLMLLLTWRSIGGKEASPQGVWGPRSLAQNLCPPAMYLSPHTNIKMYMNAANVEC